jgi:tetratricopeptide (TPR) repeat protein
MLDLNFNLASFGPSIGPSVTAIGYIGSGATKETTGPPNDLIVPWQDVQENPPVFSLLSWHTEISKFVGRSEELDELQKWATNNHAISIKFMTAEGGSGKSRLAGEFAREMQEQDWAAGFVDLRKPECFKINKEGTLLVIDYPEEHRDGIKELLQDLALCGNKARLRVLFLTRQLLEQWMGLIRDCKALNLIDKHPVEVRRLNRDDAYELFCTAQEEAAEAQQTAPYPVKKEDFFNWLYRDPENERPLFIVASAAKSVLVPEKPVFGYKGREIIETLAERELSQLREIAKNRNVKDGYVFARTLSMATIADILPVEYVTNISALDELSLGFGEECHVGDELEAAGIISDGAVRAPKPDILAAAFTVKALARNPKTAPDIIWACMNQDVSGCLERLGRLSFDAEITLQMHQYKLGEWLSEALRDKVERCTSCLQLAATAAPIGLRRAAITICKTLLKAKIEDDERSLILNNLSNHLREVGDTAGALDAIKDAVEIYRKLSEARPQRYLPELAGSLNNLSNQLNAVGDTAGALDAIKEAVEIYRKLSEASPQRYLPELAMSLNNLSIRLSAMGDTTGALDAIKEAVVIRRKLSEASPQRYLPDLASSLNNLSNRLSAVGVQPEPLMR